jgi:hypothetical protein
VCLLAGPRGFGTRKLAGRRLTHQRELLWWLACMERVGSGLGHRQHGPTRQFLLFCFFSRWFEWTKHMRKQIFAQDQGRERAQPSPTGSSALTSYPHMPTVLSRRGATRELGNHERHRHTVSRHGRVRGSKREVRVVLRVTLRYNFWSLTLFHPIFLNSHNKNIRSGLAHQHCLLSSIIDP